MRVTVENGEGSPFVLPAERVSETLMTQELGHSSALPPSFHVFFQEESLSYRVTVVAIKILFIPVFATCFVLQKIMQRLFALAFETTKMQLATKRLLLTASPAETKERIAKVRRDQTAYEGALDGCLTLDAKPLAEVQDELSSDTKGLIEKMRQELMSPLQQQELQEGLEECKRQLIQLEQSPVARRFSIEVEGSLVDVVLKCHPERLQQRQFMVTTMRDPGMVYEEALAEKERARELQLAHQLGLHLVMFNCPGWGCSTTDFPSSETATKAYKAVLAVLEQKLGATKVVHDRQKVGTSAMMLGLANWSRYGSERVVHGYVGDLSEQYATEAEAYINSASMMLIRERLASLHQNISGTDLKVGWQKKIVWLLTTPLFVGFWGYFAQAVMWAQQRNRSIRGAFFDTVVNPPSSYSGIEKEKRERFQVSADGLD